MASTNIHSDPRDQEKEICHYAHLFPLYFLLSNGARGHNLFFFSIFLIFSFKLALSLSSFTLIKRLFCSSLVSAIRLCHVHISVC